MADDSAKIAQFIETTGADSDTAHEYLAAAGGDASTAVASFFADADEQAGQDQPSSPHNAVPSQSSQPAPSNKSSSKKAEKKKFGSLRDLQGNNDSHEEDSDKEQEYFAGGDKSGLAVQDPSSQQGGGANQHIKRFMEQARRNAEEAPPPDFEDEPADHFHGAGVTLGGDDAPSRRIDDPQAQTPRLKKVERTLHIWANGFSVDDGDLYRYDDPANARTLELINRGAAPIEIMNVAPNQPVEVKLDLHKGEDFVKPKPKYKPFSGSGQRLGSPTPGPSGQTASSATAPAPSTSTASTGSRAASVEVDASQPTVSLQIRLADGTRLPSRFNTTHTIGDVYDFVDRASSNSNGRAYSLATTFPTKELSDKTQKLGDMAEFKRGGVVVQKWS